MSGDHAAVAIGLLGDAMLGRMVAGALTPDPYFSQAAPGYVLMFGRAGAFRLTASVPRGVHMALRKACPLLIGLLAVELVRTRRHLANTEAELQETRAAALAGMVVARPVAPEPEVATPAEDLSRPAEDLSAEWEQAVPPMDS